MMPVQTTPGHALRARGFTLIEMLTVTAVVGVILAIAVPTISIVRGSARSANCQSNLRQLGVAASTYAIQNRDRFPAAILFEIGTAGLVTRAWDFEHHPDGTIRPGILTSFLSQPTAVQQCPDYHGPANFGAEPFTGYNYNTTYIGAEGRFPELDGNGNWRDGWSVARHGLPPAQIRRTTTTALFGEGGWRGGANKFMRAPGNSVENDLQTIHAGTQAFRHQGCTNVCFVDGHTSGVCTCHEGPHSTDALLDGVTGFPVNGFLAEDDSPYDPR